MKIFRKVGKVAIPVAVALLPLMVLAGTLTTPTSPVTGTGLTLSELEDLFDKVAKFLIAVSVVIAVIYIIWGGITYMAAGGDEKKLATAKNRIIHGVIGALVVFAVGVILQTIGEVVARSFF